MVSNKNVADLVQGAVLMRINLDHARKPKARLELFRAEMLQAKERELAGMLSRMTQAELSDYYKRVA